MTKMKDLSIGKLLQMLDVAKTRSNEDLIHIVEESMRSAPTSPSWRPLYIARAPGEVRFHDRSHSLHDIISSSILVEQTLFTAASLQWYIEACFVNVTKQPEDDGYFRLYSKLQDLISLAREEKIMVKMPVYTKYREIQELVYNKMPKQQKSMQAVPRAYEFVESVIMSVAEQDGLNPTATAVAMNHRLSGWARARSMYGDTL